MKTYFTKIVFLVLSILFTHKLNAQTKYVEVIYSGNTTIYTEPKEYYQLVDSVHLRHDSTDLYCDSALFFVDENRFEAFDNVVMLRGDSIELTCDSLVYFGNTSIAKARSNVFLRKDTVELYSNFVDYYIDQKKAIYKNYGKVINVKDTLDSKDAIFEFQKNEITLTTDVYSRNEDIKCNSQFLNYNTQSKYLHLEDSVKLKTDSSIVFLDEAFYTNTDKKIIGRGNIKAFYQNYTVYSDSIQMHTIDSILWAWDNVYAIDSANHVELKSQYAELYKQSEKGFFVDSVFFRQIEDLDTMYLYADTIYIDRTDSLTVIDGYRDVKVWRNDIQSVADSIHYNQKTDQIILSKNPIAWMDKQQVVSDTIVLQLQNKELDSLFFIGHAFMITIEDSILDLYSQVKGRQIDVNIDNKELKSSLVNGNAEVLYIMYEREKFSGINVMNGAKLNMFFKNKDISKVVYLSIIDGSYIPSQKVDKKNRFLSNFKLHPDKKIYKSDFQVF